jgi:hypothetical protein
LWHGRGAVRGKNEFKDTFHFFNTLQHLPNENDHLMQQRKQHGGEGVVPACVEKCVQQRRSAVAASSADT